MRSNVRTNTLCIGVVRGTVGVGGVDNGDTGDVLGDVLGDVWTTSFAGVVVADT